MVYQANSVPLYQMGTYIEGEAPGNQMLRDQVTHEGIEVNLKEFHFEDFKCFN